MTAEDRYVWAGEILRRFQVCQATLWRWKKEGKFPQPDIHIGKRQAWKLSTIAAFEASRRPAQVQ